MIYQNYDIELFLQHLQMFYCITNFNLGNKAVSGVSVNFYLFVNLHVALDFLM